MPRLRLLGLLAVAVGLFALVAPHQTPDTPTPEPESPRRGPLLARFGDRRIRYVSTIRFSTDGRRMLTVGNSAFVWDLPSGKRLAVIGGDGVSATHLSPDGRWVAGTDRSDGSWSVVIWDAATGIEVVRQPSSYQRVIGFDPAGRVWVEHQDANTNTITCQEVPSGRVVQTLRGFEGTAYFLLSPDGRKLVAAGWTAFAVRDTDPAADWHVVERYEKQRRWDGQDMPRCPIPITFSPDGWRLFTTGWFEYEHDPTRRFPVTEWDVAGKPTRVAKWPGEHSFVFTPDGRFAVGVDRDNYERQGELRVRDAHTGTEVFRFDTTDAVRQFAFTPDGTRLVIAHTDATLTVWDWPAIQAAAIRR